MANRNVAPKQIIIGFRTGSTWSFDLNESGGLEEEARTSDGGIEYRVREEGKGKKACDHEDWFVGWINAMTKGSPITRRLHPRGGRGSPPRRSRMEFGGRAAVDGLGGGRELSAED